MFQGMITGVQNTLGVWTWASSGIDLSGAHLLWLRQADLRVKLEFTELTDVMMNVISRCLQVRPARGGRVVGCAFRAAPVRRAV
jgi:hypothetical protein